MIGRLWLNTCQICTAMSQSWFQASLFYVLVCFGISSDVRFWLCLLNEPLEPFFNTESRLLRMSSIGMRQTSLKEWPAWLKLLVI